MIKNITKFKSFKSNSFKKYPICTKNITTNNNFLSAKIKKDVCGQYKKINKASSCYYSTQTNVSTTETNNNNNNVIPPTKDISSKDKSFSWEDAVDLFMEIKILGDRLGYHWQVDKEYIKDINPKLKTWDEADPIYIPIKSWTYNFRYLIINFSKKKIYIAQEPLGLEGESLREMVRIFNAEPVVNGEIFYLSKLLEEHSRLSTEESDKSMQNLYEHIGKKYREKKDEYERTEEGNLVSQLDNEYDPNNPNEDSEFTLQSDFFSLLSEYIYARGVEKKKDEVEKNMHPLSEAYSNHFLTKSRSDQMREEQWYEFVTQSKKNLSVREKYDRLSYTFAESEEWYKLVKEFNLDISKFPFYSRVNTDLNPPSLSEKALNNIDQSQLEKEISYSGSSPSKQGQSLLFDPKASLLDQQLQQGEKILSSLSVQGDLFVHDLSSEDNHPSILKELRQRLEEDEFLMTEARKLDNLASLSFNNKSLENFWETKRSIQDKLVSTLNLDFANSQSLYLKSDEELWEVVKSSPEYSELCKFTDFEKKTQEFEKNEDIHKNLLSSFALYTKTVYPRQRLLALDTNTSPEDYQLLQALSSLGDSVSDNSVNVDTSSFSPSLDDESRMVDVIKFNLDREKNLEVHAKFLNKFNTLRGLFSRHSDRIVPLPPSWINELKNVQWPVMKWEDIQRVKHLKRVKIAEKLLN